MSKGSEQTFTPITSICAPGSGTAAGSKDCWAGRNRGRGGKWAASNQGRKKVWEITTKDPEESDVEESIDDTHKSSEESEEEENVDNNGEDQLYLKLLIGIAIQLLALCLLR